MNIAVNLSPFYLALLNSTSQHPGWNMTHFLWAHSSLNTETHHLRLSLAWHRLAGKGQRVISMLTGVPDHLFQHLGICLVKNKRTVTTAEEPGRSGTGMPFFSPVTSDLANAASGIRLTWAKLLKSPHKRTTIRALMDYLNAIWPRDLCRFVNRLTGGQIWSLESAECLCAPLLCQVRKTPACQYGKWEILASR